MRVLFWTEMFWPYVGGVEVLSSGLLVELRARGHDVIVVTSHLDGMDLPDVEEHEGVPIHRFHFREPFERKDVAGLALVRKQLADLKQRFEPDLVHLHFSGPSAYYHLATQQVHPCPELRHDPQLAGGTRVGRGHVVCQGAEGGHLGVGGLRKRSGERAPVGPRDHAALECRLQRSATP